MNEYLISFVDNQPPRFVTASSVNSAVATVPESERGWIASVVVIGDDC